MAKNDTPGGVKCSFCGKTQESVKRIVAGPGVYICSECIALCNEIIESEYYAEDEDTYTLAGLEKIPSPKEIKEILINLKRVEFIKQVKKDLYDEASEHNDIIYY